ncbi:MAG: nucleotide sugar dehydrogenase [Candidatus Acidiferrales bacterium]
MARIGLIGLWHLGTVAAAGLASLGHTVRATDPDTRTVASLERSEPPVFEPGLAEAVRREQAAGRLQFVASVAQAVEGADAVYVTFDTPVDENDHSDLTPILNAVDAIVEEAPRMPRGVFIVVMSQVPAGTLAQLQMRLREAPALAARLIYQPENLRLGRALETFLAPDFLVVGADEPDDAQEFLRLYRGISTHALPMSWESAELSKHAVNAFLASSISFANELADLAEVSGADVREVMQVLRRDRRIGPQAFLDPGPGFSGGTLARDVQTLRGLGARASLPTRLLDAALEVNRGRLARLAERVAGACGGLRGATIALLGLTYKPGTSTLRRSASLEFAARLTRMGAQVRAHDPQVHAECAETRGVTLAADPYQAAERADAVVLMTPWPEFRALDFARLRASLARPVLVDAHNFLDRSAAGAAGLAYWGVGLGRAESRSRAERAL